MSAIASTPTDATAKNAPTSGRLFFLDLSGGRILSANPDGSDLQDHHHQRKSPEVARWSGARCRRWAHLLDQYG